MAKRSRATRPGAFKGRRTHKKAKVTVATVKKLIQGAAEKKEILTDIGSTLNATQTNVIAVNLIGQGDTVLLRTGVAVQHSYIEVDLGMYNTAGTSTAVNFIGDWGFWAIVLDRQPNKALAAYGNIFDNTIAGSLGNNFRLTTDYQDRFRVIAREEYAIGCSYMTDAAAVAGGSGAVPYHIKRYIDLSQLGKTNPLDQRTTFVGAGATIAAINSGALLFVVASALSTANNNTTVVGQVKWRFTDI